MIRPFRPSRPARALFAPALFLAAIPAIAASPQVRSGGFTLPNGLAVEIQPDPSARTLRLVLIIPPGTRGPDGVTALAPAALRLGGGGLYGYRDVDEQLEALGASVEAQAGADFAALRMQVFPQDLRAFLGVVAAMLAAPIYPDLRTGFTRARREAAVDPQTLAFSGLLGSEGSLAWRLAGQQELKAWHRAHWLPAKARLLVSGPLGAEELKGPLTAAFEGWTSAGPAAETAIKADRAKGGLYFKRDPGLPAPVVLAGVPVSSEAEEEALDLALGALPGRAVAGPGWRALRGVAAKDGAPKEAKRLREALVRLGQSGLDAPRFAALLARRREGRRAAELEPGQALLQVARRSLNGPLAEPTLEGTNALLKRLLQPDAIRVLVVGASSAGLPGVTVLKD